MISRTEWTGLTENYGRIIQDLRAIGTLRCLKIDCPNATQRWITTEADDQIEEILSKNQSHSFFEVILRLKVEYG